jgi:hypothetical protein
MGVWKFEAARLEHDDRHIKFRAHQRFIGAYPRSRFKK